MIYKGTSKNNETVGEKDDKAYEKMCQDKFFAFLAQMIEKYGNTIINKEMKDE